MSLVFTRNVTRVQASFVHFFLPLLHDYNMKVPNLLFGEGDNTRQRLCFSFLYFDTVFRIHLQKHLLTFDELNDMEQAR